MARLPRYQESGLISADIPRMDFANLREESRQAQTIGDALTKISEFAFGRVREQREQQNKLLGIQLRTDLEMQAEVELANLLTQVETGQLKDQKVIQQTVTALGQQGAKLLGQYSVEQANGYMNSITGRGRAILAKSSDRIVKEYQANADLMATDTIKSNALTLEAIYETAETADDAYKEVLASRSRVSAYAIQTSNPVKYMQEFEKAAISARDNVLVRAFSAPEFASRPSAALQRLDKGDAGRYTEVWKSMTTDEKEAVRERMFKRQADIYSQTEKERKANQEANRLTGLDIREQLYRGKIGPNEAIRRLRAIDDISGSEMQSILKGEVGGASDQLYGQFQSLVDRGQMGEAAIDSYANAGIMSWKQANALKSAARSTGRDDAEARRYIDKSLGVPDPGVPGFINERTRAAQVQTQFLDEKNKAAQAGDAFNPMEVAQRLVKTRKDSEDTEAKRIAEEQLKKKLGEAGLKYKTDYTEEDLSRAGVNKRTTRQIMNLQKDVRGE